MEPMTGSLRRIIRAKEHLDILNSEIRAFLASDFCRVEVHDDPDSSGYIYQPYLLKPIPIDWGIILGDFIHNLRVALDNIAWSCAITKDDRVEFPIFINKSPEFGRKLKKLREDIGPEIEALQPFNRPDREKRRAPLWVLHRMDIINKHRIILPGIIKFRYATGKPREYIWIDFAITRLNKGDMVIKHPLKLSQQINFKPNIIAEILFDVSSDSMIGTERVDCEGLFRTYEYIREHVYPKFAKFLEPINGFD
jgi:hypothetical protein